MVIPGSGDPEASRPLDSESTAELLMSVRRGDEAAMNRLLERCLPSLRRWAHGRLPAYARQGLETADLVQDTVIATLRNLDHFAPRGEGALQGYLRRVLANRIKDVIRQHRRRGPATDLPDDLAHDAASPLDQAIGAENVARYESALDRLRDEDRHAIIARLELQYSYDEMAVALDKPSAAAARMAVKRALQRLALAMQEEQP